MNIEIYIPSRSRWKRSLTLEALQRSGIRGAALVVPALQAKDYVPLARRMHAVVMPCPVDGIAATRQFIGQHARNKFIMIDDDLRFYYRDLSNYGNTRLYKFDESKVDQMRVMLSTVEKLLDRYAHVAISARGGNNNLVMPYENNSRPLRALAYRRKEFLACEHGRVEIMEDFDVTLQLLKKGFQNCVITAFAQDQLMTQIVGGCSDYRTRQVHARSVSKMYRLHKPYVKLRMKENKTGGEFGKRLEATIFWEKAWKSSIKEMI